MASNNYIAVDKIKWWIVEGKDGVRYAQPLCPTHHLRLTPKPGLTYSSISKKYVPALNSTAMELSCAEGHDIKIPRQFSVEQKYVIDRLDALTFEKATFIYLDDKAIPVSTDELKDKESPVWVKAKVTESKAGLRLIVWAGDRSKKTKTQLFVEPELKRMSFDQNDDHPMEVFAKVDALFADGVNVEIKKEPKSTARTTDSRKKKEK